MFTDSYAFLVESKIIKYLLIDMILAAIKNEVKALSNPKSAKEASRFFKTGPG